MGNLNKKGKECSMGLGTGSFDPVLELKIEQTSANDGNDNKTRLGRGLS